MATLDISTFLKRGQQYTFSFTPSFFSTLDFDSFATLTGKLQTVAGMSQVYVHTGDNQAFSNTVNVTFVYAGDGSDVVANLASTIMERMSGFFGSYNFIGATSDGTGVPEKGGAELPDIIPSTTAIVAIVVGLAIVAFLASGGAGLIRRATS